MKTDRRGLRWVELKSGARRLPAGSALGGRAARAQPGAARCPPLEERDSKMGRIFDPLQPLVGAATCSSLPFLLAWCHQPVAHTMEKVTGALEFSRGMLCRTHAISDQFGACLPQDCMPRCPPSPHMCSHIPHIHARTWYYSVLQVTQDWPQNLLWEGGRLCFT